MTTQTHDKDQIHANFTNSSHWYRLAFMLLFVVMLQLAGAVMWALCAIQFLYSVIAGQDNLHLKRLGASIATYIYQVLRYLSYNSDDKPYPFSDWPMSEVNPGNSTSEAQDIIEGQIVASNVADNADDK